MTRKQSFAIFCRTGYDVRGCKDADISQETISAILGTWSGAACQIVKAIPGAKMKCFPKPKGDWLQKDYELFFQTALKQGEESNKSVLLCMKGFTSGFGRWISQGYNKGKDGCIRIRLNITRESGTRVADYLNQYGKVDAWIGFE